MIGTSLYFALDQQSKFNGFKKAYARRVDDDPNTIDLKYTGIYTDENLLSLIDFHRGNRDLLFVLTGVAYAINIVDAAVDAHLFYFDVNDDISGNIRPTLQQTRTAFGRQQQLIPSFTLTLKFTKKHHRNAF